MLDQSLPRSIRLFAVAVALTVLALDDDAMAAQSAAAKTWDAYASDFIEATFRARPYHAVWAGRHIGHIRAGGLAAFYEKDVPGVFASVQDPQLQEQFRTANAGAKKAMKGLDAWFAQQEAAAMDDFALGAQRFAAMLHATDRMDLPLTRLKEIAERDLERNLAALRDACNALVPSETLEACVAKVRADKTSVSSVATATEQLSELRSFVEEKKLVTIPGGGAAGCPSAALPVVESRLHPHSGALREERASDLLHCAAGSEVDQGGTGFLRSRLTRASCSLPSAAASGRPRRSARSTDPMDVLRRDWRHGKPEEACCSPQRIARRVPMSTVRPRRARALPRKCSR
jgi:hypothetical protein